MPTLSYPDTLYQPSPWIDLSSRAERERLSAAAIAAFFNIMDRWKVRDESAKTLLAVSNGAFYELKKRPKNRLLDADKLSRISYLVGIFKALNILHSLPLADEWVSLPNSNRLFGGLAPLELMVKNGAPAMQLVRRLLDVRRGGG